MSARDPRVKRVTLQVEFTNGTSQKFGALFVTPESKAGATLGAVKKLVVETFTRMSGVAEITS